MRDNLKTEEYFNEFIEHRYKSIDRRLTKLANGQIKADRVIPVKQAMASSYLHLLTAKYSLGTKPQMLKDDLTRCIEYIDGSLRGNNGKVHIANDKYRNQYYFHTYQEILQVLSLALLLKMPSNAFDVLVDVLNRDRIKDQLFEYILVAQGYDRGNNLTEQYDLKESQVVKVYEKIRASLVEDNNEKSADLIGNYLGEDFYNPVLNLFESHKEKVSIYCGYWSFESVAVVAIKDLDDSSFRDNPYYPKDLVDYYRSQN